MKDEERQLTHIIVKYDTPNKPHDFIRLYVINDVYSLGVLSVSKRIYKHEYDEIINMIQRSDDGKSTICISGQPDWLFNKFFVIRDSEKLEETGISLFGESWKKALADALHIDEQLINDWFECIRPTPPRNMGESESNCRIS